MATSTKHGVEVGAAATGGTTSASASSKRSAEPSEATAHSAAERVEHVVRHVALVGASALLALAWQARELRVQVIGRNH